MTARTTKTDLDAIVPGSTSLTIEGIPVKVRRIRTREFLGLMGILTKGLGSNAANLTFHGDDPESMRGDFIALFILAIPNAIDEFAEYMLAIVDPVDPNREGDLSEVMKNPPVEVLLDIVFALWEQEQDDLVSLVGKARAFLSRMQGHKTKRG